MKQSTKEKAVLFGGLTLAGVLAFMLWQNQQDEEGSAYSILGGGGGGGGGESDPEYIYIPSIIQAPAENSYFVTDPQNQDGTVTGDTHLTRDGNGIWNSPTVNLLKGGYDTVKNIWETGISTFNTAFTPDLYESKYTEVNAKVEGVRSPAEWAGVATTGTILLPGFSSIPLVDDALAALGAGAANYEYRTGIKGIYENLYRGGDIDETQGHIRDTGLLQSWSPSKFTNPMSLVNGGLGYQDYYNIGAYGFGTAKSEGLMAGLSEGYELYSETAAYRRDQSLSGKLLTSLGFGSQYDRASGGKTLNAYTPSQSAQKVSSDSLGSLSNSGASSGSKSVLASVKNTVSAVSSGGSYSGGSSSGGSRVSATISNIQNSANAAKSNAVSTISGAVNAGKATVSNIGASIQNRANDAKAAVSGGVSKVISVIKK